MPNLTPSHLLCVLRGLTIAACAGLAGQLQAQTGGVTPPMRADAKLSGANAGGHSGRDLASCQNLCKSTAGCTGFSFAAPVGGSKSLCWAFKGALTETAQAGVVSCRMPCEPPPRMTVLPRKDHAPIKGTPAVPALSVPAPPPPSEPKK